MSALFPQMYETRASDRDPFGDAWVGPDHFEHFAKTKVAQFDKIPGGDGQTCAVYCEAAPARFYTIIVHPGHNSIGDPQAGYEVVTGSGEAGLAARIARAIADGMLGFRAVAP